MPQSFSGVFVHLIFSTKERYPFLRDETIRVEMHSFLAGTCQSMECNPVIVGGVADHVHILSQLSRKVAIAEWVKEIKRSSSHWVKPKGELLSKFAWQARYGAFSVSPSVLDATRIYIENQEEHHKKQSFQDEFRDGLRRYGLVWDEQYVWD